MKPIIKRHKGLLVKTEALANKVTSKKILNPMQQKVLYDNKIPNLVFGAWNFH